MRWFIYTFHVALYSGYHPQTSMMVVKPLRIAAWTGAQSGRINVTTARVDHMASDH